MGLGTDQPGSTRQPLTSKTSFAPLGITSVANSGDATAPDRHVGDTVDIRPNRYGHTRVRRSARRNDCFFFRTGQQPDSTGSVSQMRAQSRQINTDLLVILHQQNACSSISKDEYLGGS
jgi:hypothetical protein